MIIEWSQELSQRSLEEDQGSWLSLVADCCQAAEGIPSPCAVHVKLTDDERIRQVNAACRGIDSPTDVLSFPSVRYPQGQSAKDVPALLRKEFDPDAGGAMLGDILISWEHVLSQAEAYGHSPRRELAYLLAHGLFHLMGYDHMNPAEQKEMRRMEEKAMQMAGLPREGAPVPPTDDELLALARLAMQRSYSPYSRYPVGACLLCADGRVFQGCNIENASFGLSNCAERTALFKAVSEGVKEFSAIAIAGQNSAPYPCGACRQVLNEFAPDIRVLITWGDGQVEKTTLPQLLPHGFGPKSLP